MAMGQSADSSFESNYSCSDEMTNLLVDFNRLSLELAILQKWITSEPRSLFNLFMLFKHIS